MSEQKNDGGSPSKTELYPGAKGMMSSGLRVSLDETSRGIQQGVMLNKPGDFYNLGNSFKEESSMLGGSRFREVYFRTVDNNIYRIDDSQGVLRLIDRRENWKKLDKKEVGWVELEVSEVEKQILEVGKPFEYAGISRQGSVLGFELSHGANVGVNVETAKIAEIVVSDGRQYNPDMTSKHASNSILKTFEQDMPPVDR